MKTITAIIAQKKDAKRCNIYLDGAYFCGMELITVMSNRLKVGMQIEESALENMQAESETQRATDKAFNYIGGSLKTEKQLRTYLSGKGYMPAVVDNVAEKIKGYGYIDDKEYAAAYVESYSKNKGKRLILKELNAKGVSSSAAEEAIENIENELDSAIRIAQKYLKNKEPCIENKQKCYRRLLSKGFDFDTAKEAVEKVLGDEDL